MSVNRQLILGRIGKDIDLRYTPSGKAVASFSVATTEKYGDKEETTWHDCIAWEKTAETISKFFAKGSEIFVEGRTQKRSYDNKDGVKVYVTEVVVNNFSFTGGSKVDGNQNQSPQNTQGSSQNSNTGSSWGATQNNNANGGGNGHAQGCQCPDCIDIPF